MSDVDIFGRSRWGGGKKGPRGPAGPRGSKGEHGEKGTKGQDGKSGSIGPRGLKGEHGESGTTGLCAWLPNTILNHLQKEDELMCFLLTDPTNDIIRNDKNKIIEWVNRNKKKQTNITAEIPAAEDLIHIFGHGYALDFQKSRYWAHNMDLFVCTPGSGYFCITFRVDGGELGTLVTNHTPDVPRNSFHEITVSSTEIRIHGWKNKQMTFITILHNCKAWTTLFLEYHRIDNSLQGSYIINNNQSTEKSFSFDDPNYCRAGLYIGARKDNTQFMDGAIHAVESYFLDLNDEKLPRPLRNLIIKNQMIKANM